MLLWVGGYSLSSVAGWGRASRPRAQPSSPLPAMSDFAESEAGPQHCSTHLHPFTWLNAAPYVVAAATAGSAHAHPQTGLQQGHGGGKGVWGNFPRPAAQPHGTFCLSMPGPSPGLREHSSACPVCCEGTALESWGPGEPLSLCHALWTGGWKHPAGAGLWRGTPQAEPQEPTRTGCAILINCLTIVNITG